MACRLIVSNVHAELVRGVRKRQLDKSLSAIPTSRVDAQTAHG